MKMKNEHESASEPPSEFGDRGRCPKLQSRPARFEGYLQLL
jgi:hypothetical protein